MVCLIMSLPLFSQTATDTDSLISIPTNYARQIASELTLYDLCQHERDSLKAKIIDINDILSQDSILILRYKLLTDSLYKSNENLYTQTSILKVDIAYKKEKINKLKNTRNITFITTLLTAILPIILKNE